MKSESRVSHQLFRVLPSLLLALGATGVAQAQEPAPIIGIDPCAVTGFQTFNVAEGAAPTNALNRYIAADAAATWSATGTGGSPCTGSGTSWTCAGMTITLPAAAATQTPNFSGNASAAGTSQVLRVTAANGPSCSANFTFRATAPPSGGWGDPHLTTVDGVHYDFQSAGEFTALREDGFELQTRQSPVPTATVPITNQYTGITHCVAIYTAVAAKLGSSRVTVQPSPGAEPDPNSMQVRVDGKILALGETPHIVYAGGNEKGAIDGTITRHPEGVFELTDARGTQVVVTSAYWNARKVWYLNVDVFGTSAHQGTMGKLGTRSWLPSLPDGSSVGPRPDSDGARYEVLYEKFADAWRVTDQTSLFDYQEYGPGVNTATYTLDEWPRNNPRSCAIEGDTPVQAATQEVAEEACANVATATRKADCIFDVMVTGNVGFGKSYEVAQRFSPLLPGWYSPGAKPPRECPKCPTCEKCPTVQPPEQPWWCCWTAVVLGILVIVLLIILVLRARKKP